MLAEAAATERNVMCCNLHGLLSRKQGAGDGLGEKRVVDGRCEALITVAIEEMTHLAIVGDLTVPIGGPPHARREIIK